MLKLLKSQPLGILGALSILGMLKGAFELPESIALTVEAWTTLTRPVVGFTLGWIPEIFGWSFPALVKDYICFVFILTFGHFRASLYLGNEQGPVVSTIAAFVASVILFPVISFIWPSLCYMDYVHWRRFRVLREAPKSDLLDEYIKKNWDGESEDEKRDLIEGYLFVEMMAPFVSLIWALLILVVGYGLLLY